MFASQVDEYLSDDLLGTDSTHAVDNFDTTHPLYQGIKGLAALTKEHPALRDGAQQNRYASDGAGIYAFSRTDRSRAARVRRRDQQQLDRADRARAHLHRERRLHQGLRRRTGEPARPNGAAKLSVTVPALSAVVYESDRRLPAFEQGAEHRARPAGTRPTWPAPGCTCPPTSAGSGFNEVTFYAQDGSRPLDVDRHR